MTPQAVTLRGPLVVVTVMVRADLRVRPPIAKSAAAHTVSKTAPRLAQAKPLAWRGQGVARPAAPKILRRSLSGRKR